MNISSKAKEILERITKETTKLGDLRTIAKEIKKDHGLAMELWSEGGFLPRQSAILIMDKKMLSEDVIDKLIEDITRHENDERDQLIDWLMANQLSKDKKTIALMESWEDSQSSLKRRVFWYYQARLRWVGQVPPPNTEYLLSAIESRILDERPEVQWAMNFTAAQVGIFQPNLRFRCVAIGETTGIYKDEIVPRGCTPNYLPQHIAIQVSKLKK
ncbi:MAG: DNA alkylation repair protein [Pedobacter sp.]|nr:MAG: DNA alkylation repair protein [Pedobacter sp.]